MGASGWRRTRIGLPPLPSSVPALPLFPLVSAPPPATIRGSRHGGSPMAKADPDLGKYQLGWSDTEAEYIFKPKEGLNEAIIREMSAMKREPAWMLAFRLKAYERFLRKPVPTWGGGGMLDEIDFDDIYYYIKPMEGQAKDWDMVPESIKNTYEKLGIPQAERKYLAGVTAQYESEVVYHRNREDLEGLGVLFCDMDTALRGGGSPSSSRSRPISGSTPRTWGSSSAR